VILNYCSGFSEYRLDILRVTKGVHVEVSILQQFYFIISGLKIIGHGNPDNNSESPCISYRARFSLLRIMTILTSVTRCSRKATRNHAYDPRGQTEQSVSCRYNFTSKRCQMGQANTSPRDN
jgi:hypothetical protein